MVSSLQKGISAAKAGQMQEALDFLKDAIIEEPQNADVWVWVAAIIDDLDKQEIFLKKALEIDPHNIPAQRGLAYLQKRKRDQATADGDHLSDHTSPISPFPAAGRPEPQKNNSGWEKLDLDGIDELAVDEDAKDTPDSASDSNPDSGFFKNLPKLSPFEMILLGVVVVVFCFIGILAASAIFDIDLPLSPFSTTQKAFITEPPYSGVFLFENDIYFDIQQHHGLPNQDVGIPTSFLNDPTIILWDSEIDPEQLNLIYETGEYKPFNVASSRKNMDVITPQASLDAGLYCFQQLPADSTVETASYWCFKIDLSNSQ
jgi:tetratricopeptide (TPR) repeat protein